MQTLIFFLSLSRLLPELTKNFFFPNWYGRMEIMIGTCLQVGVYDWLILWSCFAATFLCVALARVISHVNLLPFMSCVGREFGILTLQAACLNSI